MSNSVKPGSTAGQARNLNNLTGLDYRKEAGAFLATRKPLIDCHLHVVGGAAAQIFKDVARIYGVARIYSQTPLPNVEPVRDVLGPMARFAAVPTWGDPDRQRAWREGFLENIEVFRSRYASPFLKIWNSPMLRERFPGESGVDLVEMDSPWRIKACELGQSLGMMFMVHIADPDTWFATKYKDASTYKSKRDQYAGLERMLDRFTNPWIAAHMGGWPEDLSFLDGMLTRHPNLYLDTSATKWQVREISKHPREAVLAFFTKWKGRILFGSDIVTSDDHVTPQKSNPQHPKADQASSPAGAFDLYASRYWALRAMFESDLDRPSPIADGDLKMIDPSKYNDESSPQLRGFSFPTDLLESLYHEAAENLLGEWERKNPA